MMSIFLKFKSISFLGILLASNSMFAAITGEDVTFSGIAKNTSKACTLRIIGSTETTNPYTVQVEATIYDPHESMNEVFVFTVKQTNISQGFNIFSGGEAGKDQLNIFVPDTSDMLSDARKFSVKWLHNDHFHSELCDKLVRNE